MEYNKELDLEDIKEGHKTCSLKEYREKSHKHDHEMKEMLEGEKADLG